MASRFTVELDCLDREKWLELRRTGIGSSDAPAVLGLSPFGSPLSVYVDKLGFREDREATEAMRWGIKLEPLIAEEFRRETQRKVELSGFLLRSKERPWQIATLDATQESIEHDGPGVLEIKATGFRAGDWTNGIPDHVYAQVQHQLDVTGYGWGSVAVLLFGCRMLWADVARDDAFLDKMRAAEGELWRRVETGEPVAPDGTDASREALRLLYPEDTGEVVALPGDLIGLDAERQALKAELSAGQKRLDAIDNSLRAAIGAASAGELANGVTYTHRLQKRKAYTVKESAFRVLRRSEPRSK